MANEGVGPGASDGLGASWFRPCQLPFEVVGTAKGRRLLANADLEAVYVWAEKHWRQVGAMPPGREADPLGRGVIRLDHVPGLPAAVASLWPTGTGTARCAPSGDSDDCSQPVLAGVDTAAAAGTWLVVALQRSEPDMGPVDAQAKTAGRVVWIVQCP